MKRITIILRDPEKIALFALAEREFREPQAQAALIIRQELERCGLLQTQVKSIPPEPANNEAMQDVSNS